MKTCEHCGAEFVPQDHSIEEVRSRRYCSKACYLAAGRQRVAEKYRPRPCAWCGTVFVPRSTGNNAATQECCSRACGTKYSRAKCVKREELVTVVEKGQVRRVPYCACGNPATEKIYFYHLNSQGQELPGLLKVCPECKDYMLENDSGCSATPLPQRKITSPGFSDSGQTEPAPTAHVTGWRP